MKKVLLFGSNGQLGLELQNNCPSNIQLLSLPKDQVDITNCDIVDKAVREFGPDLIINAAAYTNVDKAESDKLTAYAVNLDGAAHCALAAKKYSARLIYISTDFVFDGSQTTPYKPDSIRRPPNVYGSSKAAGEIIVESTLNEKALIIRTSWLYGIYGHNFVKVMLKLMSEKDSIKVVGDQISTPTWAHGLADAIWKASEKPDFCGIQHWSDAGCASWYDFSVAIQEEATALNIIKSTTKIDMITSKEYPTMAVRPSYSLLDKNNSYKELGVANHWRQSLREMLLRIK